MDDQAPSRRYGKLALFTAAAFLLSYLLTRHQSHTLQLLPYAILFACPLMHFFMHSAHGHRHGSTGSAQNDVRSEN